MNFDYPESAESFRAEVRGWLDANVDDRFRNLAIRFDDGDVDGRADWLGRMRAWNARLADAGYAAIAWPVEYGGRGASVLEEVVLSEELHRAGAPPTLNPIGIANIAPAILQFGTADQKASLLPRMLTGQDIWCQGFSEPDAGSDLASLQTRAVRDGDDYIVNGQKVWNTFGDLADWCELLVRTDPAAPKHKGISCLLVDMRLPGIEVRPLVTMTGEREFCELFFTDVRVPASALLGAENAGWNVAIATLANERAGVANLHLGVRTKIRKLIEAASMATRPDGSPALDDGLVRQDLAQLYVRGEHLRFLADRAISGALHGRPAGAESSLVKLEWSELEQEVARVASTVLGPDGNTGTWGRDRLYTRALTIAGGTTQVNKNILAQRVLGLPRA